MYEPVDFENEVTPLIKVIGVGGGGGNAVEYMAQDAVDGTEFFIINTDAQALRKSTIVNSIQIGSEETRGLGAGANPAVGKKAAEDDKDAIQKMLAGANMVFIAAGMGGGTGTGAAPVVAKAAKSLGILTVAVITKPFKFEGKKRMLVAEEGLSELVKCVDSLIVIPNEKLITILPKNIGLLDAFAAANDVLKNAVRSVSSIITAHGMINTDFNDVKTVMSEMGYAMMGIGRASGQPGDGRAEKAITTALNSPLLDDIDLSNGAKGLLINITAGEDINLSEFGAIGELAEEFASDDAVIVTGTSIDPSLQDEIIVTVVATGIASLDSKQYGNPVQQQVQPQQVQQVQRVAPQVKQASQQQAPKQVAAQPQQQVSEPESFKNKVFDIDAYLREHQNN
ncbi:MAG: cell division protein FtsZ [Psittacicella sp.]